MKIKHIAVSLLLATLALFSCKNNEVKTPADESIERNHPKEIDSSRTESDTTSVIKDSLIDHNMKGQSDTHGRDTDAGR